MKHDEIDEIKRIFMTRLDTLSHLLDIGERDFGGEAELLAARLAPDMWPLGTQVVAVCNQPRGFSQWCAGLPVENLALEVTSLAQARAHIADTRARVDAIRADDRKLDEVKRVGLGPGRHAELPARRYVNDYLMPNFYFHLTIVYALLRHAGAGLEVRKQDFLTFLAADMRETPPSA